MSLQEYIATNASGSASPRLTKELFDRYCQLVLQQAPVRGSLCPPLPAPQGLDPPAGGLEPSMPR